MPGERLSLGRQYRWDEPLRGTCTKLRSRGRVSAHLGHSAGSTPAHLGHSAGSTPAHLGHSAGSTPAHLRVSAPRQRSTAQGISRPSAPRSPWRTGGCARRRRRA
ncbi:hypothetical protein CH305_06365 [Rhodococcus sp. 15-649-2-2]|nr:hypothetical protein CH305_06365 [Rhodococcus sp. 15-649-2-2]